MNIDTWRYNQGEKDFKRMQQYDAAFIRARFGPGDWWYVDPDNGDDGYAGNEWSKALATMTEALDQAASHDIIFLKGALTETVATPDSSEKNFITIIGVGRSEADVGVDDECFWVSEAVDECCLTINGVGYKLINLRFGAPTTEAAVKAIMTSTGDTYSTGLIVEHCYFYGQWSGLYGIDLCGAPSEFEIRNCIFTAHNHASGIAITCTSTAHAIPFEGIIQDCIFRENKNHISMAMNSCIVKDNVFQGVGHLASTITSKLNISSGNDNIVTGNFFGGTYSNAGGYTAGTGDQWHGNHSDSVGLATVHASGLTINVPGA